MRMSVEITGQKELQRAITRIQKNAPEFLNEALVTLATDTQAEAVKSIQAHQSSGNVYQSRTVTHTASTAGNPPNSDTGTLVRNITVQKIKGGYDVGSRKGAPHGFYLEFGTSKIDPRPWLAPAYQKAADKFLDTVRKLRGRL